MPRKSASRLEVARELHERQRNADAHRGLRGLVNRPAAGNKDQRNAGQVNDVAAGLFAGHMAGGDVRDFMRHHARQLSFVIGGQNQPRVDVEKSARQREGVDLVGVDDLDGEGHLGIGVAHQVLADAVHILRDHRIGNQFRGVLNLLRILPAHGNLLVQRVPVPCTASATHVAVADRVDGAQRFLAGCVLVRLRVRRSGIFWRGGSLRSGRRSLGLRSYGRRALRRIRHTRSLRRSPGSLT